MEEFSTLFSLETLTLDWISGSQGIPSCGTNRPLFTNLHLHLWLFTVKVN